MNPVFDKTGSLHKTLAYEILSGFYPAGSKLPSERDLSEKYRISRNTVRLTLEELEAAGAIRRRPAPRGRHRRRPGDPESRPAAQPNFRRR